MPWSWCAPLKVNSVALKGTPSMEASCALSIKMEWKQIDLQHFSIKLWSGLLKINVWKPEKCGCECFNFLFGSLCLWHHEQGQNVWHMCQLHCELAFSCSSLAEWSNMAVPIAMLAAGIWSKKCFCCINIDGTTIQSLQIDIFVLL